MQFLTTGYNFVEVQQIFAQTADMLDFFEEKSGVKYNGETYTQVLAEGGVEQELYNLTIMRKGYGKEVLKNERLISLAAHEMAHQWWGNRVTCIGWTHFWLNEGFATFMAAAYREHKFGMEEYLKAINNSKVKYENVKNASHDRSLIFANWNSPSMEDRILVYHKGAYFLHQLRQEVGEDLFWRGIKKYTQTYNGKHVTTEDFKNTMEVVSHKNLHTIFEKWVYGLK